MSTRKMARASADGPAQQHGTVKVTVRDRASGIPLVDAALRLYQGMDSQGIVLQTSGEAHLVNWDPTVHRELKVERTGAHGIVTFTNLEPVVHFVLFDHVTPFANNQPIVATVKVDQGGSHELFLDLDIDPEMQLSFEQPGQSTRTDGAFVGNRAIVDVVFRGLDKAVGNDVVLEVDDVWQPRAGQAYSAAQLIRKPGRYRFSGDLVFARRSGVVVSTPGVLAVPAPGGGSDGARLALSSTFDAEERTPQPISGNIGVSLSRTETEATPDLALWTLIRNSTEALSFNNYMEFLDQLFCQPAGENGVVPFEKARFGLKTATYQSLKTRRALPFTDSEAYRVLKAATEAFVMVNCGVLRAPFAFDPVNDNAYLDRRDIPANGSLEDALVQDYLESVGGAKMLPYLAVIRRKLPDVPILVPSQTEEAELCFGIIQDRLTNPCLIELIWNYWQEEGMLVQTMNVITQRFQNLRGPSVTDPLANTEIDMLRPLNNLLWGYTQDEQHRLTVVRRNYEYDHHYGIRLDGKAVRGMRPADSRSKFLEAFHHLLRLLTTFYKQDDDTTVKADAFPILNALKEVHLILSQGAHNQYGDLPSTARIEMLMQQWLLARPEFREFLPTRVMVAYPEPWMDRVDAMKKLQTWSDTSVMHFRNLAIFGEQLLLSIRFGHWSDVYEATQAFNWARFWRPQAQGYIHAYRAATGVDLSADSGNPAGEATLPSVLLRQRLAQQQRSA
jgi:hypothetical protein